MSGINYFEDDSNFGLLRRFPARSFFVHQDSGQDLANIPVRIWSEMLASLQRELVVKKTRPDNHTNLGKLHWLILKVLVQLQASSQLEEYGLGFRIGKLVF